MDIVATDQNGEKSAVDFGDESEAASERGATGSKGRGGNEGGEVRKVFTKVRGRGPA